jgi:S-adenosyl-L-methionine hydrolase (adenosine-forming)
MRTITLMTDFGLKDGNVGVMKGVILNIAPQVQIVDLSHLIAAQNIAEAALILWRSAPYFPDGTIHVVVVDPGVGTERRPMLAQIGEQYFVGPDNGLITPWLGWAERQGLPRRFIHLNRPQYWLPQVSHVFHGRDIFAPSAAHLAAGVGFEVLGSSFDDPIRLVLPEPRRQGNSWQAEVIHIDHFGNIATNLRVEHLAGQNVVTVGLCGVNIDGMVQTFGERPPGELVALFGSTGNLIVSVVNGSAAQHLKAAVGNPVNIQVE